MDIQWMSLYGYNNIMSNVIIQGIGFVGVLLFVLSYQIKSNRALFIMQGLGSAVFCLQFFLMGQLTGSYSLIVVIMRNAMLAKYDQWAWVRWKGWVAVYFVICLAIWTNNAQKIRLGTLVCGSPCWLIYDIIVGSWGGILNESILIGSILVSIYRYGWKAMGENKFDKS